MKTYREWIACYRHIDVYLRGGDEIDQELADYFRDNALTRTKKSDYIQLRTPFEHYRNANRKNRDVYATIHQKDGRWFYAGLCFAGETAVAVHHIFLRETFRKPEFGMVFFKSIHMPFEYVKNQENWYSVISGKIDGILRPGVKIHIVNKAGREISVEETVPWAG